MVDMLSPVFLIQVLQALAILVGAVVFIKLINWLLLKTGDAKNPDRKRVLTNVKRFVELITYLLAVVLILWTFEVDITGLLAGLGVGALVIGFALKDIFENWVSGFLIISGKTFTIGDVISVGNMKGVVTHLSLRTTTLKTYDRNEVIIPNSVLLKERIVNLTGGGKETIASLTFAIDYVFDAELVKSIIRKELMNNKSVVIDEKRKREIRFLVRCKEWTTEIEALFWIDIAENEEFIKSEISENINRKLGEEKILPPIPALMRKDYLEPVNQKKAN
jgi:small-conductance mechanosensitive channel